MVSRSINVIIKKQIADFGLSRDLRNEDYYVAQGGLVPVRWTAPEALQYSKYSTASDVWSFGVVLYEIWSLASKPYGSFGNDKVIPEYTKDSTQRTNTSLKDDKSSCSIPYRETLPCMHRPLLRDSTRVCGKQCPLSRNTVSFCFFKYAL